MGVVFPTNLPRVSRLEKERIEFLLKKKESSHKYRPSLLNLGLLN